ncbi:hypothetical protein HPP92_008602 [Vanilla planifolia]|uniref:Uncharacterized protein n=1 Tax=Vanilla planifolia TaxID=51239 RepID=A0A835RIA6_VANPL|nr:hypothetical protein HPP92_008602 [Vanilla planifolia]
MASCAKTSEATVTCPGYCTRTPPRHPHVFIYLSSRHASHKFMLKQNRTIYRSPAAPPHARVNGDFHFRHGVTYPNKVSVTMVKWWEQSGLYCPPTSPFSQASRTENTE